MNNNTKPTIAICYDFDLTLSKNFAQHYSFIDPIKLSGQELYKISNTFAKEHSVDYTLAYLYTMINEYKKKGLKFNRTDLNNHGKSIEFFEGVKSWFKRINEFGNNLGVNIEHHIISSGIKPIIEGTSIAKEFKNIFACEYVYDKDNYPIWPSQAINYTNKTQFLYRISKGRFDINDHSVNDAMESHSRPIPFNNIVYIGDSDTDIPCMRLTVKKGGHSIGVYNPNKEVPAQLIELVDKNRINFYAPADYTEFSLLDTIIKEIILKVKYSYSLSSHTDMQKKASK